MAQSLIHANGNIICVVDVETTGLDPEIHEIVQICILPLDSLFKPIKEIRPFYVSIKPENTKNINKDKYASNFEETVKIPKAKLASMINEGLERGTAADLLQDWFDKLQLPFNKRIMPLGQNWVFDRAFIIRWLGWKMFEDFFDPRYRDTMAAANYVNDKCDFMGQQCPYQKVNLGFLCSTMKVENASPHDALSDCIATAEIYRRMLMGLV